MAKGDMSIVIETDKFMKATRLNFCKNRDCKFFNSGNCEFKEIEIDEAGRCRFFEKATAGK